MTISFAPNRKRIAVIGGGISGLSAAWLLDKGHDVTLYESRKRLGGHSHTVDVDGPDGKVPVDTGFIVYNPANYPNLTRLFDLLQVPTRQSEMSFAASLDGGRLEYSGSSILHMMAQPVNALRPRFWAMVGGILRFFSTARNIYSQPGAEKLSLQDWLEREGYAPAFIEDHILPMGAAIWSCSTESMREFPANSFIRFFVNHGLLVLGLDDGDELGDADGDALGLVDGEALGDSVGDPDGDGRSCREALIGGDTDFALCRSR